MCLLLSAGLRYKPTRLTRVASGASVSICKEWGREEHQRDQLRSDQLTDLHRKHRAWEPTRGLGLALGVEMW